MTTSEKVRSTELTIREATIAAIAAEMRGDPDVFIIGQDIREFGGPLKCTDGLFEEFGADRLVATPICESSMMSAAIGAAAMGLRPIVDLMFSDMLPLVAVPLIQTAGYFRYVTNQRGETPMVVRTRGGDGPYRAHPQNYEALFAHSPGLVIVEPSNPTDAYGLMRAAIRSDDPVIFMENIFLYNAFREEMTEEAVELGKARVVRSGDDVTVVAYARAVRSAEQAAEDYAAQGVEVEVIDLRTLHPWDEQTVAASVRKTGRLVIAHEAWTTGGLGAEIAAVIGERCWAELTVPPVRLGAPDIPIPWAPALRDATLPTSSRVGAAIAEVLR